MSNHLDTMLDIQRKVVKALTDYRCLPADVQREAAGSIKKACDLLGNVLIEKAKTTSKEDYA